jgi:hypothetical protein
MRLQLVAVAIALTCLAAPAAAGAVTATTGEITGRVVDAVTNEAISGIEVCAFDFSGPAPGEGCTTTDAAGEYAVAALPEGQYLVEFFSPVEGTLNYAPQFYDEKASAAEANLVAVTPGQISSGVNARLKEGGRVSGLVVAAATKQPVAGVEVCAFGEPGLACALTSASGQYTIAGLASGEYIVGFFAPLESGPNYAVQFYDGRSSGGEADPVHVLAGATTSEIDAELVPGGSITGRVTDALSGAPIEGAFVCALWPSGEPAECEFSNEAGEYTVPALFPATYHVRFAAAGYVPQYYRERCTLAEADPVAVKAEATTAGIAAPMQRGCAGPKPPPPRPVFPLPAPPLGAQSPAPAPAPAGAVAPFKASASVASLVSTRLRLRHRSVTLKLSCSAGSGCRLRFALTAKRRVRVAGHTKTRRVTLGATTATIAGARTVMIKMNVSTLGAHLLAAAHGRLAAQLAVTSLAAKPAHVTVLGVRVIR